VSEWQSPQDYPRRETDGIKRLVDAVASTSRQVRESTSNLLRTAGIYVTEAGMRVARSLLVEGDFASTGSADIDGALNVDAEMTVGGNATFSGAMRIEGTLSLPAGIIDNEALANPLALDADFGAASGFGLAGGAWVEVTSASITIPPGFTRLQFIAAGMVNAVNSTGGTQNLYVQVGRQINGVGEMFLSPQAQNSLPGGFTGTATALYVWNEAVNPGETHRFSMRAWVSASFAPTGGNYTRLDVAATFTR